MISTLIISLSTCALMVASVIVKPYVKIKKFNIGTYWLVAILGALTLIFCRLIDFKEVLNGLWSDDAVNPIKILILFISMTIISVFLDEIGFFKFVAHKVLSVSKSSQKRLFFYIYAIVSFLTIFTSNDIVVLTFTPFIIHFCKAGKISPLPYLIGEFVGANTFSMMLVIGNPTNVFLSQMNGTPFFEYLSVMFLPTLFAGITAFLVLILIFNKKLSVPLKPIVEEVIFKEKFLLVVGLTHLILCTVLIAIATYVNVEMWYICLAFCLSLILWTLFYRLSTKTKPVIVIKCLKRAPWELIPFVIGMFVIVLALDKYQITTKIAEFLGSQNLVFKYGVLSTLSSNIINNIPMSVLFSSITNKLATSVVNSAVYATIIGSNIGAFLTPVGALAGIMWSNILKSHEVKFSFLKFIKYGAIVAIPTLLVALFTLSLVI